MFRRARSHALALAAALPLAAGALSPSAAEVKIGVLLPHYRQGLAVRHHQEVAPEDGRGSWRSTGSRASRVKLVVYDTRGENTEAINLTRKLIHTDHVLAIVGPFFSGESEVAFPIANQGKTPIVTAAAAKPGIAASEPSVGVPHGADLGQAQRRRSSTAGSPPTRARSRRSRSSPTPRTPSPRRTAPWCFPAVLKARGIEVIDNISFQTGDIDYSAQVTKVKGAQARRHRDRRASTTRAATWSARSGSRG